MKFRDKIRGLRTNAAGDITYALECSQCKKNVMFDSKGPDVKKPVLCAACQGAAKSK